MENRIVQARSLTAEDVGALAELTKALAHPSRLAMIEALSRGEHCVRDLTVLVGHDISTVSKHLTILRDAGIVEDEKRGKQVYCRLRLPCVLEVLYALRSLRAAGELLAQRLNSGPEGRIGQ